MLKHKNNLIQMKSKKIKMLTLQEMKKNKRTSILLLMTSKFTQKKFTIMMIIKLKFMIITLNTKISISITMITIMMNMSMSMIIMEKMNITTTITIIKIMIIVIILIKKTILKKVIIVKQTLEKVN